MRIYFCSDIHASRKCWKKFLNSWKFYEADHIVVGGDITGKFVVPIIERAGGSYSATFLGIERDVDAGRGARHARHADRRRRPVPVGHHAGRARDVRRDGRTGSTTCSRSC